MNTPMKPLNIAVPAGIANPKQVVGAEAMLQQVQAGIKGVKDRISGLDLVTVPAAYIGPTPPYIFQPQTSSSFNLDVFQNGTSYPVNYIMQSGTTYQLPIIVGGNGVFLAHRFRINLWQRLNVNGSAIKFVSQAPIGPMVNGFYPQTGVYWTTKFSCWPVQPKIFPENVYSSPSINYRWNIQDPVTGYNYSDNLMPSSAILNRNFVGVPQGGEVNTTSALLFDGDWHEFDAPWRFDQAYQLNVLFRPVVDIVQFDSSVDIGPAGLNLLDYDDRISGQRNQAVTIQVEFQGERIGGTL